MPNSHYKHVIWDWNGTLFDDAWLCVEIMNGLLVKRGLPPLSLERYQSLFDFPVIDYYRRVGFDFAVDSFENLSNEFIGEYQRRMLECQLRPQTREVLEGIQQLGLTQSILSAMKQEMLDEMIEHFALTRYFADVVGISDHHAAGKIDSARRWMAKQAVSPADMVFVGDTTHDYEVAQELGVTCWSIASGHHSEERLAALSGRVIEALPALLGLINA
ncbi:MAG: HAD family hydrolase [Chloroflexi bacterium]|nr:HAD family hydrolase [Chloroflexota bacterium]